MRIVFSIVVLFLAVQVVGQDLRADLALVKSEALHKEEFKEEKSSFFKGILKVYSNHISDQIINDCIYEESCSEFSQGAMRAFGPLKGSMLSMDRMMRCNRLSQSGTMPVRFNEIGKISDHWYRYAKKK
ncbi:MAG: membrane protein insertion efficiency factor YidD [Cytophagales bacterium]|nr:membrane protein insertion efficiency factor YidD [Cytophagales bacterium]